MLLPWAVSLVIGRFYLFPQVTNALEEIVEEVVDEILPIVHLQTLIQEAATAPSEYLITGDAAERARFTRLDQGVERAFEKIQVASFDALGERQSFFPAWQEWRKARVIALRLLALPYPVTGKAAARDIRRMDVHVDRSVDTLNRIHGAAYREITQQLQQAHAAKRRVTFLIVVAFELALMITVGTAIWLARSVLTPLRELQNGVDHFGAGDLSHRIALDNRDELGRLAAAFNAMAEKLQQTQSRLEDLSIHDALTGLYNRREFQRRLKQELDRSRRYRRSFALLMLDVDHFKAVNDAYGHLTGDQVLRAVSALLTKEVRPEDVAVRYGGEEFVVLLPETPHDGALVVAERIRNTLAASPITAVEGRQVTVTASIGVVSFPEQGDTQDTLIAAVDRALYAAKQAGRNRVRGRV